MPQQVLHAYLQIGFQKFSIASRQDLNRQMNNLDTPVLLNFRPHIMGAENNDVLRFFFQMLPNLHDLHHFNYFNCLTILYSYLTILVTCYSFKIRFV